MNYTILVKSNWVGAMWKVHQVSVDKKEAHELAIQAREDNDRVVVKSHRKSLGDLTNYDNMVVKFSDGTIALHYPL